MKLYIPDCGTRLTLSKDWNFRLYNEYRNESLIKAIGKAFDYYSSATAITNYITLPIGTVLVVDRVYVRKGSSCEYNSLSFRIKVCPDQRLLKCRFWASLEDCNTLEYVSNYD
jgi:hypothetical protein